VARAAVYAFYECLGVGFLRWRPAMGPLRAAAAWDLKRAIKDPELRRKLTPDYAIGCKRVLFSNDCYPALAKPNAQVVTTRLDAIGRDHLRTADGRTYIFRSSRAGRYSARWRSCSWLRAPRLGSTTEPPDPTFLQPARACSSICCSAGPGPSFERGRRLYNKQVDASYRWAMRWNIFSEVMVFAALFGTLLYIRVFSVPGVASGETGQLWPGFKGGWPTAGPGCEETFSPMSAWVIPAINTLILLASGAAVTWAHLALKKGSRGQLKLGLFVHASASSG
jgi:hypothetical protein